jgi:hypothetical protein
VRGRLVARLDASLVELQGFYVPDEAVLALARRWTDLDGPSLSPLERNMVRYARRELEGGFSIRQIYKEFKGRISHRQLVKLGRRWEVNGWLLPPPSACEPRQVTDELSALADVCEEASAGGGARDLRRAPGTSGSRPG